MNGLKIFKIISYNILYSDNITLISSKLQSFIPSPKGSRSTKTIIICLVIIFIFSRAISKCAPFSFSTTKTTNTHNHCNRPIFAAASPSSKSMVPPTTSTKPSSPMSGDLAMCTRATLIAVPLLLSSSVSNWVHNRGLANSRMRSRCYHSSAPIISPFLSAIAITRK